MKIAITAASGSLGRTVLDYFTSHFGKNHIVGIARSPEKIHGLGVDIRKGDYENKQHFLEAFHDIDVALVISGNTDSSSRIIQHRNVIDAAREAGVKKIVYTSIFGHEGKSQFDAVIKSNRQTESDLHNSGLDWIIARNGLYIEPDVEAIEDYIKEGKIRNSAGEGKCAYTSRQELANAYATLVSDESFNKGIYNLCGEAISQYQLADIFNEIFDLNLVYEPIPVDEYFIDRKNALGDFYGQIIGGIYQGIRNGVFNIESDFEKITGRKHLSPKEMIEKLADENPLFHPY